MKKMISALMVITMMLSLAPAVFAAGGEAAAGKVVKQAPAGPFRLRRPGRRRPFHVQAPRHVRARPGVVSFHERCAESGHCDQGSLMVWPAFTRPSDEIMVLFASRMSRHLPREP